MPLAPHTLCCGTKELPCCAQLRNWQWSTAAHLYHLVNLVLLRSVMAWRKRHGT